MSEAPRGMTGAAAIPASLTEAFEAHRSFLWGLGYRLTGCAADADDVVQDTFLRAVERPPTDTSAPWRPWLVRVALNLGRDALRRRRRRRYVGPWLPSPIETGDPDVLGTIEVTLSTGETTEGRYDLLESISYAFLLALEALTPKQRAVLLLRDVFDYDVDGTAEALGTSAGAVKVTHHRARKAMAGYDADRTRPTRALEERTRKVIQGLMRALSEGDRTRAEAMLAADVRAVSDGGGEFVAARVPIEGRERVALFYTKIAQQGGGLGATVEIRPINGLPAMVVRNPNAPTGIAPRSVTLVELTVDGHVRGLRTVVATRKLTHVGP